MTKRKRRQFTDEFKKDTVRLIRESGKTVAEIARDLDLSESAVRNWLNQAEIDAGRDGRGELTTAERQELQRLRRENKQLQMEREILKKRRPSSPRKVDEVPVHRGGEGPLPSDSSVPRPAPLHKRFLRVDEATGFEAGKRLKAASRSDESRCRPGLSTRDSSVWRPAHVFGRSHHRCPECRPQSAGQSW